MPLLDEAGETLLIVVDDEVSVLQGRRVAARFRELALVAAVDEEVLVDVVVARLGGAGAAVIEAVPNHVRALGPIASVPEVDDPALSSAPSAAEVVTVSIAAAVTTLMQRDPRGTAGPRTPRTCTRRGWPSAACAPTSERSGPW